MNELKKIFEKVYVALKPGKRCIVIVMDIRQGSQFIPFHMDVSDMMKEIGYVLEDIIIWNREREYSNLRPLGYPYVFIVNKIHEYILIFRKDKKTEIEVSETIN
jgi:DNA modification methylase